jgi:uncharacterized integral membrane protein
MFSKRRPQPPSPEPGGAWAPGVDLDQIEEAAGDASPAVGDPQAFPRAPAVDRGPAAVPLETRGDRFRRQARRTRLHLYALAAVALLAFLIALAALNTTRVKVSWVFGSSHVSLVWLVLFTAILGWLLGNLTTAAFHWRTREPHRRNVGHASRRGR